MVSWRKTIIAITTTFLSYVQLLLTNLALKDISMYPANLVTNLLLTPDVINLVPCVSF